MSPNSLSLFFEAWEFFREAALASAMVGLLLGFLGVYIVLRRMVFISAALAQASGFGIATSFYVQLNWGSAAVAAAGVGTAPLWASFLGSPLVGATTAALLMTLLLSLDQGRGNRRESVLGLAYLLGSAGTLALGTRIVEEVGDIQSLLFGNAVVVLQSDFRLVTLMTVSLMAVHLLWMRGFVQASFDSEGARVRGLPVRLLNLSLMLSLAVAVSVSTRVLGALPVFAFSVLPGMAAVRLAPNTTMALLLAAVLGAVAGFGGYLVAFVYQLPVGASQTLVAASFVVVAELIHWSCVLSNRLLATRRAGRSTAASLARDGSLSK